MPVPRPRKRGQQMELEFAELTGDQIRLNDFVNQVRERVKLWRNQGRPYVTYTSRRLLDHWTDPQRDNPVVFCQLEAAETAIYLAEAAQKTSDTWIRNALAEANAEHNAGSGPHRAENGDRKRQDRRDGDADRLADAE